jgi:hypothetical protein
MNWQVILNGDQLDLKFLAESFNGPDYLIRQEEDKFTLSSAAFESLNDPAKITELAQGFIDRLNGGIILALDSHTALSIGGLNEVRPDGVRTIYVSERVHARCRAFATMDVRADGSVEKGQPADPVRQWADLASRDQAVADVLALLGTKPADWVNLYRIYEIVQDDCGGIVKRGWATDATIRNFKHTGDHPKSAGLDSRHGRRSTEPPKKPMLLSEARALIFSITLAWLREK